jgi:hypothetical protein
MLKRRFLNFKLSLVLVVFFLPAFFITSAFDLQAKTAAVQQATRSCLWTVNSQSNKIYLLGSLHLLKPNAYPLAAAVGCFHPDSEAGFARPDKCPAPAVWPAHPASAKLQYRFQK